MGLKKQVIQLKDGEEVAVYNSSTEAAEAIGSTKSNISKCCCGKLKQVNGFVFKYSGEFTNKKEDSGDFKCPYCDRRFESYNGLTKHVFGNNGHEGVTQEKLLTDFAHNGVRPTCKCGCGEYTDISYVGGAHFCDYKQGHQSRVHNNWGHNETAKIHSAETRRKQYASGERIQWNKGKTWEETFDEEKIDELMKMYENEERNQNISDKLRKIFSQEKYKEQRRQLMYRRLTSGEFSISSKSEERFIEECIVPLGVEFTPQYYIKEIRHYCDVYIPSKNTIIEFQGDYWHGNPKRYLNEDLSVYQLDKMKKDDIEREFCKQNGIKLIEVWESDFNDEEEAIVKMLREELK